MNPIVPARDPETLVSSYYRAIDDGEYDRLAALLTAGFSQVREDMTIEGRAAFVQFMREERPETDTCHDIEAIYLDPSKTDVAAAVRGRLFRPDGSVGFGFVDVFDCADGRLDALVTYTNRRVE